MEFTELTADQLRRAIELMVAPEWLNDPAVMIAILKACDFTQEDVSDQLDSGQQLNAGSRLVWRF